MISRLLLIALVLSWSGASFASPPLSRDASSLCKKKKRKKSKKRKRTNRKKTRTPPPAPPPAPRPAPEPESLEDEIMRGERIEFDARLIRGQTAKAGAVYLFERASTNLRSMVRRRKSFRQKIVRTVFPPQERHSD